MGGRTQRIGGSTMSIERELLIMAQKIQDECMSHNNNCDDCPLVHNCIIPEPYTWKIPDIPAMEYKQVKPCPVGSKDWWGRLARTRKELGVDE